jgi:hypothetical protein
MRGGRQKVLTALAVALCWSGAVAAGAGANHVQCGATLYANTTLDSDLVDCPTFGVEIATDGVTLDLGGHMIDGNGRPDSGADHGVRASGRTGLTIENGMIAEFSESGAELTDVTDSVVSNITFRATPGDALRDAVGVRLTRFAQRNQVAGNSFTGDYTAAAIWIAGFGFPHPPLEENRIEQNVILGPSRGMWINSSDANVVTGNVIAGAQFAGMELFAQANANVIEDNLIRNTRFGEGISFVESDRNIVRRNHVVGGGGDGIDVQFRSNGTVLDGNRSRRNRGDGILVRATSLDTVVRGNHADRNGDDGIDIGAPGTVVTANHAFHNAALGIEAVPGVVDGGRNRARDNGDPAECVGVACR